jgi:prepilin peptidase dependent protein C
MRQQGFSLPEVLLSVVLMVMVVTALSGLYSQLATGSIQLSQYRALWREAGRQTLMKSAAVPEGWTQNRVKTSRQRCVSITATITTPAGKKGQLTRLHCPRS